MSYYTSNMVDKNVIIKNGNAEEMRPKMIDFSNILLNIEVDVFYFKKTIL